MLQGPEEASKKPDQKPQDQEVIKSDNQEEKPDIKAEQPDVAK